MKTMAALMLIFAISIGYATFIENDYGTITAKAEIYNARWFEVLLAFLALTLIINIFTYKMYTMKKAPIFLFHIAFLIILFGAAITRYVGYEGTMHIREGDTSSTVLSSKPYINITINTSNKEEKYKQTLYLSKKSKNNFSQSFTIDNKNIDIQLKDYLSDAVETIEPSNNGKAIAQLMITGSGPGKPAVLEHGNFIDAGNYIIDFQSNKTFKKPVVHLFMDKNNTLYMNHNMVLDYFTMDDRKQGKLQANKKEKFNKRTLYGTDLGKFVLRDFLPSAVKKVIQNPNPNFKTAGFGVLKFDVKVNNSHKIIQVYIKKSKQGIDTTFELNGAIISIAYGSINIPLDFSIKLLKFQLDRYPGSMSPASYASEVILIDKKNNINMPYRIFMNNILDYKSYRFFQASYDRDEKGTVLSVNHDPGTLPSYIGYFVLALGMFWSLFSSKTRFAKLKKRAIKMSEAKIIQFILTIAITFALNPIALNAKADILNTVTAFNKIHSDTFGKLISQDSKGRMKPVDTLSTEIMAKVHGSITMRIKNKTLDANQIILGMIIRPNAYKYIKLIKTKDEKINKILGINANSKYAAFSQFFEDPANMRGYKLSKIVDEAARKAPKNRNKLDKAALKVDEKVNVVYMVYSGKLVKIWPKPKDVNNKWFATIGALQTFSNQEKLIVKDIIVNYFLSVGEALQSNDWTKANENLKKIAAYQIKNGSNVYPSENKIKAEIFYNHSNIFETLYPLYFLIGFILLILSFVTILYPKFKNKYISKIALFSLVILFSAHTFGLILRWYISGHAPWSNGYESMIYISWATLLAGFIFSKHSPMTLASTSILTGLIVFVAHLNWMNPQVTNLVPVLNSYWLSIHVSMITASYGFLGLGALLGFINIILFIIKSKKNEERIEYSIKELNAIGEMTLMTGLFLLTVGNFLGGVWANESWGRYWGWDPKETWALVTIIVYAIVLHVRFIKSIYSEFIFTVMALLSFTSVLMTYFGVNYYLAGMHSYAKGDPVPIPDFVPITYAIIFIVIVLAFRNRRLS